MFQAAEIIEVNATLKLEMKNAKGAVTFVSSDANIATVNAAGLLTGLKQGTVTVSATDASGKSATSLDINVGAVASTPTPNPGNPSNPADPTNPGTPMQCPLGDPQLCQIACQFAPTLPWCTP